MTQKIAVLFPGQGSQYVGMGKSLSQTAGYSLFAKADSVLGYPLWTMMSEGPDDQLKLTHNTQPAIVAHSLALWMNLSELLKAKKKNVDYVLGHSVGEYAALAAAGVFSFEAAIKLVHLRGKAMQEAVPADLGKMFAVLKAPQEAVEEACAKSSDSEFQVVPANFNDPTQIVISGHSEACEKAIAWLKENLATPFRAIELNVSAPFHSPLMKPAAEVMKKELAAVEMKNNQIDYIANIDATLYGAQTTPDKIRQNLVEQMAGSVRWTQSIAKLPVGTLCIEVGPGRVLQGLVKKIQPELTVISLDKEGAFNELEEALS